MHLVFLLNLGSPRSPDVADVRAYLREFLSDKRVIDISPLLRFFLVNFVIAPFRAPQSAAAYKSIWTSEGSPLLVTTAKIRDKLQSLLDPTKEQTLVVEAMRYGEPSFESQWQKFRVQTIHKVTLVPLYPHYASSSGGSALEAALSVLQRELFIPPIEVFPPFFSADYFIEAQVDRFHELQIEKPDHVVMSFHGLPERHIRKTDPTGKICHLNSCCDEPPPFCYRAHCVATARLIAKSLKISESDTTISFQSRLGRDPWLLPNTEQVLKELAAKGHRHVAIFSPSFVADCLETLEELKIRAREIFQMAGGKDLTVIPCVNDSDRWIKGMASVLSS